MATDKNPERYVIALANSSKDYISIKKSDVGHLLSCSQNLLEVSFPRQRCYMHKSQVFRLNGEERAIVNTFKRIEKADKAFSDAQLSQEPKGYLEMSLRLLNGVELDIKDVCEEASKEIDKCRTIIQEWLAEIEQDGQIHYEKGAQYFSDHIDDAMRFLGRNILRRIKTRP